ncbi:hypothetical protein RHGRI_019530 [Rhododendron griersonianum]|uniref:Uncharacterized protein n=1 Tax=Rhododendron griersonianum TaxID=479676 RepID=A0AAV6JFU7_9ERIC|nr:hypothetical protein RHGRI_019530 [Rhododendron griersonianum]
MATGSIEVEMPREFERLQNTVIEAIIGSSAHITHGRRITLELRNFTILKQLLRRRKIKGLSVKTNWFKIGAGRFRMGILVGRFANTEEELGWSEFVDLGVLLDRDSGYIADDIITFHADVHLLDEEFYRGNAELRLRGFDVNAKVEGEPTIWVIANFSAFLDVMATSIIVGPSFKFGKLALRVVIMIKGEYLYGRLDCDASSLTDYEKNVEISYSMGFYVHGEGRHKIKYRHSKLLLQSMNDDGVSLKKVSEMPATRNEYGVTVSCRILGLLRTCEGIPIQEQAEETASHENNRAIVAWYPPPIYGPTSSSTLEPAQVPRDIDLSPGQPLQSNQPSGNLGVIGGRSISDLGAFSDNIGESSANSGGMHDQIHNLQMLNASLDMPATVLQPVAPTMKGEKQKGENTQGPETSSPSPNAFNLTDFSCEPGVGSTIASLEAAIPQIMAMQEMLNQYMNLEKDMQKQLITMVSAPAEDSRRLEIVGERMDKLLKANTDALWDRMQKETGKREKLVREHTQQMTSLITNFINKDLPALVEKTVKKEFTAIEKAVSVAIEKAVSFAIAEAFQKEVGGKAVHQLEKSVNLKLEATVARQIQAQLQTSGKQALQETLKSSLEGPVIRAFEMSCKAVFEKVDTTFDHATVAQQQFESTHSPLAPALMVCNYACKAQMCFCVS